MFKFKQLLFVFFGIVNCSFGANIYSLQNATKISMFYYNVKTGQPLCGEVIPNDRRTTEKIVFGRVPCSCGNLSCGCCAGIKLSNLNFNRKACTNFTYDPLDFAIQMDVTMNDKNIFNRKFSAKNPPPLCTPLPYAPIIDFCVRFYNIFTPGQNLQACIDFETRVAHSPVLILHFDCIRVGADGIAWLKPEDAGGLTNEHSYYDEVDFESDNVFSALCNNNETHFATENENDDDQFGQLKEW